jgi:uncharacterized protein (TIGR02145 family)
VSNLLGYDRDNYCNVFVTSDLFGPLGFAYLPPTNLGVFVKTNAFGITNVSNYGLNRTLVHEMGHYCGLYHTFNQTSTCTPTNTNCETQGDYVCDTPVTTGNIGCPSNGGACGGDLVENFMDYTNDNCMESFTQGQTLRMLAQLETYRSDVLNNNLACGAINGIDVGVSGLAVSYIGCSNTKDITFNLQNFGDTITEATINYSINGEDSGYIIWTGNLGFAESEEITISNVIMAYGIVDIEVNVEVLGDIYEDNNTKTFQINNYEGTFIDITIEFDALPYGFKWSLYNSDTNVLIDEGGYYDNATYACEVETNTFCLDEGNYVLVLEDLFGNGLHYPCGSLGPGPTSILNGNDTLNSVTGNWGSDENLPFSVGPPITQVGPCQGETQITYNNNTYNLVPIGNKCWFGSELKSIYFKDLYPIPNEQDPTLWAKSETPMRTKPTQDEDNNPEAWGPSSNNSAFEHGVLYNWYVVNDERGICPNGYHVANNSDWNDLEKTLFGSRYNSLSGQSNSGYKGDDVTYTLFNAGWLGLTEHTTYPDYDLSSKMGLLGGIRVGVDGTFRESRTARYWWTDEEYSNKTLEFNRKKAAWARGIKISPDLSGDPEQLDWLDSEDGFSRYRDLWSTSYNKSNGLYIRCVKN